MVDFARDPEAAPVLRTKGDAALWVLPLVQKLIESIPEETGPDFIDETFAEFSSNTGQVFQALRTLMELIDHMATSAAVIILKDTLLQMGATPVEHPPETKP